MADKTVNARLKNKADTSENWAKATSFVPLAGELIFYTNLNKVKMGDGKTTVSSLPFLDAAEAEKLVSGGNDIDVAQTLYVTDSTSGTGISANSLKRPYLDGNGYYQDMVNNEAITGTKSDGTEYKVSDYQWKMNFDSGNDSAYIDTHLSSTGSIYTRVAGDDAYINTNIVGDKAFLYTQFDGYTGLNFLAKGDAEKKSLNFLYVSCNHNDWNDDKESEGAKKVVPLIYITHEKEVTNSDGTSSWEADVEQNKYGLAYDTVRNQLGYVMRDSDNNLKFVDTNYVPRLDTDDGNKYLYSHIGDSQSEIVYTAGATKDTIAMRTSNGNVKMTAPTESNSGVNKSYAEANFLSFSGTNIENGSGTKAVQQKQYNSGTIDITGHNPNSGLTGEMSSGATGNYAFAIGANSVASGENSFAQGNFTVAQGAVSRAFGENSAALGNYSTAEGYMTTAIGDVSHAEGHTTIASGHNSHAEGVIARATGYGSHAEGQLTLASSDYSHAEGSGSKAECSCSHAEGVNTTVTGNGYGAHAEGNGTTASGNYSHAEGSGSQATGPQSCARGYQCVASGSNAVAEGEVCVSSNYNTYAGGSHTEASGVHSRAEGFYTKADQFALHATGRCNNPVEGDLFEVGNGNDINSRSNALRVLQDGRAKVQSAPTESDDIVRKNELDNLCVHTLHLSGSDVDAYAQIITNSITPISNDELLQYLLANGVLPTTGYSISNKTMIYQIWCSDGLLFAGGFNAETFTANSFQIAVTVSDQLRKVNSNHNNQ